MTDDEVMRQFEAIVAVREFDRLRALTRGSRPTQLRPQRAEPVTYRVRAEIDDSSPPIWRMLLVASDIRLDLLHAVLQNSFGATGSQTDPFSAGSGAERQAIVSRAEARAGGVSSHGVTLDQVLRDPCDEFAYASGPGDT